MTLSKEKIILKCLEELAELSTILLQDMNKSKDFELQSKKINEQVIKIGEINHGNQVEFEGTLNID